MHMAEEVAQTCFEVRCQPRIATYADLPGISELKPLPTRLRLFKC